VTRILVTGASGLFGANVVMAAVERGAEVTALWHRHAVRFPGARVDLTDSAAVERVVTEASPEWIIHCAAFTDVDGCEADPPRARRENVEASRALAAAARRVNARLVYLSTDSVFDGERGNYSESDTPAPVNEYARSKLAGERAVLDELPRSLVVRTNLYGWNLQEKSSLAEWVLSRLESRTRVPGFTDVRFSPLLVNDLAELIFELVERRAEGILHLGAADALSKYEFAQAVARAAGLDASLVDEATLRGSPLRAPRPADTSLDSAQAARLLGHALPTVAAGLDRWYLLRKSGFVERLKAARGG
jgi:dTDP-4-dehydrorhamnose reductase